jgi:hypothetical protein
MLPIAIKFDNGNEVVSYTLTRRPVVAFPRYLPHKADFARQPKAPRVLCHSLHWRRV